MLRIDAKTQMNIDATTALHAQGVEDCQYALRDAARGGMSRVRMDSLQPGDRAFVSGKGWSDKRKSPADYAMEKLAQMFATDSHECQAAGWRADAGETRLFATMLKHIVAKTVPTLYIPNMVRSAFPIDNSTPAGAKTVEFHRIIDQDDDDLGQLSSKADDVMMVDLSAEAELYRLQSFGRGFAWSMDELEEAAFAGVQLQTEGLAVLARAAERVFELVALQGYGEGGIGGAYNDAHITPTAVITGTWSGATHDQIVADIRKLLEAVKTASGTNYRPNRLLVPSEVWQYLAKKRTNTDMNVTQDIIAAYPGLQVLEASPRADDYDAAGTGPRMMAYTYSPDLIRVSEPRRFTLEPPEKHGFSYIVRGRQKLGGTQIIVPLSVGYMDGI